MYYISNYKPHQASTVTARGRRFRKQGESACHPHSDFLDMQKKAAGQDKTGCELIRRKTVGIISGDGASDASALLY